MDTQRVRDTFFDLVRIPSPSRHEREVAQWCRRELESLGFSVRFDDSAEQTGSDTGNLIAELPGTVPGSVVLSAHMDCVEPCQGIEPIVVDGVIRSAGDTILSADDKAGVAAILEGVRSVVEAEVARPDIVVLFTTCEELSLLGSGALREGELPVGAPCFVFDADGAAGTIVRGAPCHYTLSATFTGKAAHAGVEPEAGISAVAMACDAVTSMALGRLDEATTANIGSIEGGRQVNIVPDTCTLTGECRSLYVDRAEAQRESMSEALQAAARRAGGMVDIDWRIDYGAVLYADDDPLVRMVEEAARSCGIEPCLRTSGGGADANVLAARGVRAVTLGIGMTSFHTPDEHISVADLENSARLAESLIKRAAL